MYNSVGFSIFNKVVQLSALSNGNISSPPKETVLINNHSRSSIQKVNIWCLKMFETYDVSKSKRYDVSRRLGGLAVTLRLG